MFCFRASVVQMVGTAVNMDTPAMPLPCHAKIGSLRSLQENRNVPKQTEDMFLSLSTVTVFFSIILVHISDKNASQAQ